MVEVEAAVGGGLPRTVLVGLADTALYEARDRCKAAVASRQLEWPQQLLTINLSPASLPKSGSHYDLAIAAAVLAASETVPATLLDTTVLFGELGLDGRVRPVPGVLPAVLAARDRGFTRAVVCADQAAEAALIDGITVWGVRDLGEMVEVLHGRPIAPAPDVAPCRTPAGVQPRLDLADIAGQPEAKWALEVAAAGRHHLYLHGAPGLGKTMLAQRLPTILPDLTPPEALEVSAIHSLAGRPLDGLMARPPYSDPHHNVSLAGLIGGGQRIARPGAISLAHRGVLFLDEAPEFGPRLLDALRTPLECGMVTIGRAERHVSFPARFQLVLAANPCPCGRAGTPGLVCECPPMAVRRYRDRLSGPILDRIDVQVAMRPVRAAYLRTAGRQPEETSQEVAARVAEARQRQEFRLRGSGFTTNGEVSGPHLRTRLPLPDGVELLDAALVKGQLSARGVDKSLRIAWTLADLAGRDRVDVDDVRAALVLRRGEAWAA